MSGQKITNLLRSLGLVAVTAGAVAAAPAAGQAPAVTYPASRSLTDVFAWLRKDTPISPAQVVDISPSAITAVISSAPTGAPRGFLATIASEAVNPDVVAHDGIASWSIPAEVDCERRQVRLGAMTGFRSRDLRSDSRVLRPADAAFVAPTPTAPLGAVVRALCDRDFKRPTPNGRGKAAAPPAPAGPPPIVVAPSKKAPPAAVEAPVVATAPKGPEFKPVDAKAPASQTPEARPAEPKPAEPKTSAPQATAPEATPKASEPKATQPKTIEMPKAVEPKTVEMPAAAPPPPKPKPKPKPPAGGGPVALQLGASPSPGDANILIARFKQKYASSMGGLTVGVVTIQADGKTAYRVLLSGFATSVEANQFCGRLQAGGQPCFVRR